MGKPEAGGRESNLQFFLKAGEGKDTHDITESPREELSQGYSIPRYDGYLLLQSVKHARPESASI